jgi:SAM-dependent methyltransferase
MDKRQRETVHRYAALLKKEDINLAHAVGRRSEHLGAGKHIWADITSKLIFRKGATLLDIGCGYGEVTRLCMKAAIEHNINLHLIDITEALGLIRQEMGFEISKHTYFWEGIFPEVALMTGFPKRADFILVYSVLHYTDHPERFVDAAVSLLASGGRLLLGDLPNVHKKGRFLSSYNGRKLEAVYRGVPQEQVPVYKNQFDYFERCQDQNKKISDDLVERLVKKYRRRGYDVYVLPQTEGLPFSRTREDVLICRN